MWSDPIFIGDSMEIRTDLFLRWKEGTPRMRIKAERVEDARYITRAAWVRVDVPNDEIHN
jgi:hypothetical protein